MYRQLANHFEKDVHRPKRMKALVSHIHYISFLLYHPHFHNYFSNHLPHNTLSMDSSVLSFLQQREKVSHHQFTITFLTNHNQSYAQLYYKNYETIVRSLNFCYYFNFFYIYIYIYTMLIRRKKVQKNVPSRFFCKVLIIERKAL